MFGGGILIANEEYIKLRMSIAGDQMSASTSNAQLYEFYKGQFLAFREVLEPEIYGLHVKKVEKSE